jgi:SAM-dependent MidA family methyltransferase
MPDATKLKVQTLNNPTAFQLSLAERIAKDGPLSVEDFMQACVSAYYARQQPFGAKGDFITAPGVSQMFGEMIAVWVMRQWQEAGMPKSLRLIELGPGDGTLMADMLRILKGFRDFTADLRVSLVETSPRLKEKQRDNLSAFGMPVSWHDDIAAVDPGFAIIVANEFFDALPIRQFRKSKGQWQERCIGFDGENKAFFFTTRPPGCDIAAIMPGDFVNAQDGSVFEISPVSLDVTEAMAARLKRDGGAALIIDYGYAAPGLGDTLQCVSGHKYADVLESPGEHDMTAHVDFATLKSAAASMVTVEGPFTQADFLFGMGIALRAEQLKQANPDEKTVKEIDSALSRLTAPDEMGHLFKALVLKA